MKLELKVPSIVCEGCIDTIKKAIVNKDSNASVSGDVESKKVVVETETAASEIERAIADAGHTVE